MAETSRNNEPVDFDWDCDISGIPADDDGTVRQQVEQWVISQADGWDSGDHDIDFDTVLSGDNYTIEGTLEYNQDERHANITQCFGVNRTLPIQFYWACEVEGDVPPDSEGEIKGAVQQHISEAYLNWGPGEHQVQFEMQINDLNYRILARVEYQNDPRAAARIVDCESENG